MAFYKIKSGRVTGERGVLTFVGEIGHLFYSQDDNVIRISDGHTPGGIPLSGGSITFISIGAPPNPQDGQLWFDPVTGRLYVWYDNNWVDASPDIASTATGITLSMLTVGTGSATGGGALSYDHTTGVFTFQPADTTQLVNGGPSVTVDSYGNLTVPGNVSAAGFVTTGTIVIPNDGVAGGLISQNGQGNIYYNTDNSLNFIITGTYQHIFNADGTITFGGGYIFPNTQGTQGQILVYDPAGNGDYKLSWQNQITAVSSLTNDIGYLTSATVNQYVNSFTVTNVSYFTNDIGYLTNSSVGPIIANSLTNYATKVYVNSQGFITADIFTVTNVSTFVNDAHYLQVETGVHSVTGTANQVIVTYLGNRDIKLSTPQNLNTTATVTFGNLTVNNLNVLNTITNLTPAVVEGYRLYLASNSTQDTQIDGGGIVLGTSTWTTGILYSLNNNYWYTMDDAGFQTEHLIATKTTVTTLTVTGGANIGYSNLMGQFSNALLQIDAAADTYSQVNFQNHSSSTWASGDFVVTNDIGTDGKHYIDMGINSSRWSTSSWVINGANDGYLYIDSGNLAIGTTATEIVTFIGPTDTTDSIITVANATTITYSVDLMPSIDAQYLLGRPGQRWKGIYVGTGSVWINDISLGTDAELTVDNGVLYVNGAFQLQVGQLKFFQNTIESTTGGTDIQIGQTTSTANIVLNRNVILATGKTFGLQDQLSPFTTSTLSVIGGILTVSNAAGLQAGQIKINNNVIESTTGATDIQIGLTTSTANLVLNRNTVIATGKSLVFGTGGLQTVAWNSTATVLYNQITGVPGFATTATVNTLISNSLTNFVYTGTVKVSVTQNSAATTGSLTFTTSTGVFTFTPTAAFNTGTLVTTAVNAINVTGGYVKSITAGTGTSVSTSTGIVTVSIGQSVATTATPTFAGANFAGNVIPTVSGAYELGSDTFKWGKVHVGPHTLSIEDQTLGTDAEITVVGGVLRINGANQLQVGQLHFVNNTIESTSSNIDIQIGLTTSTANLVLNRNVVMASGKGLTYQDSTTQYTAYPGTAQVGQVGGVKPDGTSIAVSSSGTISTSVGLQPRQIYYYNGTTTLNDNQSPQNLLGFTQGVAVVGGLRYRYILRCQISCANSNVALFYGNGGSAVYSAAKYWADVGKSNYGPGMMPITRVVVSAAADNQVRNMTNIASPLATNTVWDLSVECIIDVTTSGNLEPLVLFSPTPGNVSVLPGGYMEIYSIGSNASYTAIGTWS